MAEIFKSLPRVKSEQNESQISFDHKSERWSHGYFTKLHHFHVLFFSDLALRGISTV